MTKKNKETTDEEIKTSLKRLILVIIFGLLMVFWAIPTAGGLLGVGKNMEKCWPYTNVTGGGQYIFGKCYFSGYNYYETREVCRGGFIGIGQACYESSETHYESYRTTKCIVAKTGERC